MVFASVSVDATRDTEADLSWSYDTSWTGSLEVWRDRENYDYSDPKGELVATLGDGPTSYTDTGLHPNTAYTYTLVAVRDSDTDATSDSVEATTTGPDVPKTRTRSAEWVAEIRLDDRTLRPPVVGEPDIRPRANDLPEIRIPTTDGPWTRLDLTDGAEDMLVWYQGIRQPIEELERIEEADDGHVLVGRGGTELLDRVQVEVDEQPAYELVEDLLADTSYAAQVDPPPEEISEETIHDVVSASAWANLFANADLSQTPVAIDDSTGELYNQQICWTRESEDADTFTGADQVSDSSYSNGTATLYDTAGTTQLREYDFTTNHAIPAGEFGCQMRFETLTSEDGHGMTVTLEQESGATTTLYDDISRLSGLSLSWVDVAREDPGEIPAGTHTIRVERTSLNDANVATDVIAPYDARYESDLTFDNSVGSNGELDGPQFFGTPSVETDIVETVLSVVGASVTSTWNDTSDGQAIQVSNNNGDSWLPDDGTEQNTDTIDADFPDPGASIRVRFTLGRHGSRDQTPATGFEPQRVDSFELVATLDDTPLVVNQSWDASYRSVLRDLADQAGGLWDVEYSQPTAGYGYAYGRHYGGGGDSGMTVNWTTPGVREATVDDPITTYDVATDVRERAARVVVVGSNAQQVGDRVQADHGTAQDLQQANIVSGTEAVYDPDTGDSYQRNDDYEINYTDGTITALSDGDISSGQTIAVDYRYETRGSYEVDTATTDREVTENITGLVSPRQCGIAARLIALEVQEPLHEAEVGFTPGPTSWSIVDQLTVNALPFEGPYTVRETNTVGGEQQARLGSRQSVEEVVADISDQTNRVARRE